MSSTRRSTDDSSRRVAAWFIVLSACVCSSAHAQPAPPSAVTPPRLVSMPEVVAPPEATLPEDGRVAATITVAEDGSAHVDDCEAAPEICALVARAAAAARFEAAQRAGTAIAARVRIVLRVSQQPTATAPTATAKAATPAQVGAPAEAQPASTSEPAAILSYGATGRAHPVQPGSRRLELAEMRDLPGAFGDPFRAVDALPGVVPIFSGLPYFYIRGSPPAGSTSTTTSRSPRSFTWRPAPR